MAEIVSFASGKGGVGKTLLTAALGIFLSRKGKKVLLIDGDMGMRNMDLVLGLENECFYHVMDLAEGRCFAKDVILEVNDHLDFLPAAQNDTWETVFPAAMDTVLEDVEDQYDYILLDCPAGRGEGIRFAEHLSDHMFLVVAPSWASKRNAERLMTGPRKRYMTYVLNQFSLSGDTQISLTDMLETLDEESVSAIIPYTEEADRLAHQGELSDFSEKGALGEALALFWKSYKEEKQIPLPRWKKLLRRAEAENAREKAPVKTAPAGLSWHSGSRSYNGRGGDSRMNLIRYWRRIDSTLLMAVLGLGVICLLIIASATHANMDGQPGQYDFVMKQGIFFVGGLIIAGGSLYFDYRKLYRFVPILYGINAILLLVVKFAGTSALGAQRWIQLGPFTLQPSEFAKIIMIICLARLMAHDRSGFQTWKSLLPVAGMMALPTLLIFIQPDLGTSLVFAAITFGMLYISGLKMQLVKRAFLAFVVVFPFIWFFVLHSYQKMRILVLFNPDVDPYGSGYHVIQSKISIGSGGFIGQGLFEGTQSQLNFLPENHTDFIFSVIGEELGFVGAIFVLFLFFVLLYRTLMISRSSGDAFGSLLACGIFSMWLFQIFINVGMTLGIMPVTGIPLPFMSYGGSALLMNLLCVGLLMNIYLRRKKLMFD